MVGHQEALRIVKTDKALEQIGCRGCVIFIIAILQEQSNSLSAITQVALILPLGTGLGEMIFQGPSMPVSV